MTTNKYTDRIKEMMSAIWYDNNHLTYEDDI